MSKQGSGTGSGRDSELIAMARAQVAGVAAERSSRADFALPGYRLTGEIHRGGQGVVYRAKHLETGRDVAIKVLREGPFAGEADLARFQREARLLGSLRHPSIVTIHDTGRVGGTVYLVMDYIDGAPLDVHVSSNRPSPREILELFAHIAEAVNEAHLRGILHRDLKPGNIRVDTSGAPHLLDFGLAKRLDGDADDPDSDDSATMTRTGQFVGSLPWASPEQAEGRVDAIDLRTDVYSLGVLLFQMLTGTFPYAVSGGMRTVLDAIVSHEPPAPSRHASDIGDEIDTIVLKCLQKDAARRYQSAGELARDLRRYLAGAPIDAKRDSTVYMLRKTLARHRIALAVASAFLLLIVVSGIALTILYREQRAARIDAERESNRASLAAAAAKREAGRAREERERAEEMTRSARRKFVLARQTAEFMMREVSDRLRKFAGMAEVRGEILREAYRKFEELLDAEDEDREVVIGVASLHYQLARIAEELGDGAGAERHAKRSIEIYGQLLEEYPGDRRLEQELINAYQFPGYLALRRGEFARSREIADERLRLAESFHAAAPDEPEGIRLVASAYEQLTDWADMRRDRALQERFAEELFQRRDEIYRLDPTDGRATVEAADALERMHRLTIAKGEVDRADRFARRCLELREKLIEADPQSRDFLRAMSNAYEMMAEVAKFRNDVAENRRWSEKMLDAKRKIEELEPRNPEAMSDVGTSMTRMAIISNQEGKAEDAIAWAERAAEQFRRLTEAQPDRMKYCRSYVWCLDFLAAMLRHVGKDDVARDHTRELYRVLDFATRRSDADSVLLTAYAIKSLHTDDPELHDADRALELVLRAVESDGGTTMSSLETLAEAYWQTGDAASALDTLERCRAVTPAGLRGDHARFDLAEQRYTNDSAAPRIR